MTRASLHHAVVVGDTPHEGCDVCDAQATVERLQDLLREVEDDPLANITISLSERIRAELGRAT